MEFESEELRKRGMDTGQERNKEEIREGFRKWKVEELNKKAMLTSVLVMNVYICSSPPCRQTSSP